MKSIRISIFVIFCLFPVFLRAQNINAQLNQMPGETSDWQFQFEYQLTKDLSNGFFVEFSDSLKVYPVSIQINNHPFYLVNISSIPERDSVLAWQASDNGLMVICRSGVLKSGDVININCLSGAPKTENIARVNLREVTNTTDGPQIASQETVSGNISQGNQR